MIGEKMRRKLIIVMLILFCSISLINGVSAHEAEYPEVHIDTPISNTEVSGNVDINVSVDDHYETQYVNFTVEHVESGTICLRGQDANPSDGWSYRWDTPGAVAGQRVDGPAGQQGNKPTGTAQSQK